MENTLHTYNNMPADLDRSAKWSRTAQPKAYHIYM